LFFYAIMERKVSLQELIRAAGITQDITRQPCLPAPTESAIIASEDDQAQARAMLLNRRAKNPEHRDVLKRIFRSSKDKKEAQDAPQFSQEELDQALSAVLRGPTTDPGLTQAFISLGANVNFIETAEKKRRQSNQSNAGLRRRSTVLQQAATLRRPTCVSLLAASGADQTTLDEGLKAALTANEQECISELLRHGADLSKFPNALANAVRSNDQNYVRTLLRAPKALQPKVISTCLSAAVQQESEEIVSLLIAYGADPNFDSCSALNMAIGKQYYKLAVALVAGPTPLNHASLQRSLDTTMRLPTCEAQLAFLQILLCCGLNPNSIGLPDLLVCRTRKNDTAGVLMMLSYGVSTAANDAECLRLAISNSNWRLVDAILQTPVSPQQASAALATLRSDAPQPDRLRIIQSLLQKGATGSSLEYWLMRAVEDADTSLMDLLISAGAPVASNEKSPLFVAVARKDMRGLQILLNTQPSPELVAKAFPLLRTGHSASERYTTSRLLLKHGAHGPEVDQALVDAVADTLPSRDPALITELVRGGASVNYDNGRVLQLAASQVDLSLLRLLCNAKPTSSAASTALAMAFDSNGNRHLRTAEIINVLLAHGVDEKIALQPLQMAISGGPENIDIIKSLIAANIKLLSPAFEYTIAIEDPARKAPILDVLLKMGVGQETLDMALAAESRNAVTNKDTTSAQMLVETGASVSHNDGEALSVAVAARNTMLTELLLSGKHQPSRSNATKAFRALFNEEHSGHESHDESVFKIARILLPLGVEQPAIDSALRVALSRIEDSRYIDAQIDALLQHKANVNVADGACFVFAASKRDNMMFEKLMLHRPNFGVIVPALIKSNLQEDTVVVAIKSCFTHGCTSAELEASSAGGSKLPILIMAMHAYPRSEALISALLSQGCNPDVFVRDVIDGSVGEEVISALLWALNQAQKRISDSVITALLKAGASAAKASSISDIAPIALAAREGRRDIVRALLQCGADASLRDKSNRSALFYASSVSNVSTVQALAPRALKNDGSLHEAARCLQLDVAAVLIEHGHKANFPSRLHQGRHALSELCLNGHVTTASQRSKVGQLIRLFLDNGADPTFKARNEKSAILLALDNAYSALELSEALLETEIWEDLNNEKHMYRDSFGLWYSPLKYVELVPSASRAPHKQDLIDLLRDKGCEPRFYSENAVQPPGAIGIPKAVARLVDRQKEHELTLKHEQERHEHARTLEETSHRDVLRRKREQQESELAAQSQAHNHTQTLEQQTHESTIRRVRDAERMKRGEKVAWHNLMVEQEHDASTRRQALKDREAAAAVAAEGRLIEQRKSELEHRAGVERRMLKDKEDVYERNVKRQTEVMKRADDSAQLHAKLRQERPAIEGAPQWGTVD
jgi:ankyrin repeat protein